MNKAMQYRKASSNPAGKPAGAHAYRRPLLTAGSVLALMIAGAASAQEAGAVSEIVVTGSRAVTNGAQAPTPLTVITAENLKNYNPNTLAESLNSLPQLKGSAQSTATVLSANNGGAGSNLLSLRALGPARTLVLLDGRRSVPTNQFGVPDVNNFPSALVERVDIVTGGASAAYGSDAVAGVVNFVLNTRFTGFKGEFQGGISSRNDYENFKVELAYGKSLLDGRARIIASADYYRLNNLGVNFRGSRPWTQFGSIDGIVDPAGATPRRRRADNIRGSTGAFGGLVVAGPLRGLRFRPDGSTFQHDFGVPGYVGSNSQLGGNGDLIRVGAGSAMKPNVNVFVHGEYDITPEITAFGEISHGSENLSAFQFDVYHPTTAGAPTIFRDNPFMPAPVAALMDQNRLTSFVMGRYDSEGGELMIDTTVKVNRFAGGLKGEISGFNFNAYYTHGQSTWRVDNRNNADVVKYFASIDTIRNPAGQIVCRSTFLFGENPGCVPFNPFGEGASSDEVAGYWRGTHWRELEYIQDVVSLDARRNLFSLWASPVAIAFGGEYRREEATQVTDAVAPRILAAGNIRGFPATLVGRQGGWTFGNGAPFAGKYSVREVFAELNVPIVEDRPFFDSLDVNGAVRRTDYSTSGAVTTWKLGASWSPVEDVRFRVTRSRDIRAPNVGELFSSGVGNNGIVVNNPLTNRGVFMQGLLNAGNPNLKPEVADTISYGVVLQPTFLPGFLASVDYYKIEIAGAIGFLSQQVALNQCLIDKNPTVCATISSISDAVVNWTQFNLNLSSLVNRGIDFEASYRFPVYRGNMAIRFLGGRAFENSTTTPGSAMIDRAGQYDQPKWTASLDAAYKQDKWGVTWRARLLNGGKYDTTFVKGVDIDDNTVAAIVYHDASISYDFDGPSGGDWTAYLNILNVFDQAPPWAPQISSVNFFSSNPAIYDQIGRRFVAGVRFKF